MKLAVISASLGGIDKPVIHTDQSVGADYFHFDDTNFPPRFNAMAPRLQAKIPKMFGWQLSPDYDAYMWLDGNIRLAHLESLQYFLDALEDHDIAVLQHPDRNTIYWEYRYNWRALNNNAPSNYMKARYSNEFLDEQYGVIKNDLDYIDDLLVNGGAFIYRDTPEVQTMLKEWFYHLCRYQVNDQIPFPYVLKRSGLRVNVLPDKINDSQWLGLGRHTK